KLERKRLQTLKDKADYVIDTSNLHPSQLKQLLKDLFIDEKTDDRLAISVISFGFKHGILMDAELIFDVRFLPNPFYIDHLKQHSGKEQKVSDYIFSFKETEEFIYKL